MSDLPPPLEMNGSSELIVGMGRVGKSGYTIKKLRKIRSAKKIFIVPRFTHPWLSRYDATNVRGDDPVLNSDDLWGRLHDKDRKTSELVVYQFEKTKTQDSIFKILRDQRYRDYIIWGEELAVLLDDKDDWNEFKIFIRTVGQNNQQFFGTNHRIKDDIPPVTALNCQRIFIVGQMADERESDNMYSVCNVKNKITREEFILKLRNQPEKYDWWSDHPNEAAVFQIYG